MEEKSCIMEMLIALVRTRNAFLLVVMVSGGCALIQIPNLEPVPIASTTMLPYEKILPGPITDYEIMQANSGFEQEYILSVSQLSSDGLKMVSRRGISCAKYKPWLMVRNIKTKHGLAVSIAYSGNWQMEILSHGRNTVVRAATLPESLKPFKIVSGLPIPGALVAEFTGHWDNGAQPITRFIRTKLLRDLGEDWPWVQYNT